MLEKVSVITVVYNDVKNIEATIQSVLKQDYENIEYIIIDGNSTDGTTEICNKYKNKVSILLSEPDTGIYNAMNKALAIASGEWIFFLNSGDIFFNGFVISEMLLSEKSADIIYGKAITKDNTVCFFPKKITISMFMFERMVCHQCIFARRETFFNNKFDERYKIIADRIWLYNCFLNKRVTTRKDLIVAVYDTTGVSSNIKEFDVESLHYLKKCSFFYYLIARCKRTLRFCYNCVKKIGLRIKRGKDEK